MMLTITAKSSQSCGTLRSREDGNDTYTFPRLLRPEIRPLGQSERESVTDISPSPMYLCDLMHQSCVLLATS